MPDQQPVLTPEQADENARQQKVSFSWMSRNLNRYKPDNHSARLIGDYIREHKLPWTEESLDTAFAVLVNRGAIEEAENDSPEPTTPAAPPVADPNATPWTSPLTKAAVRAMSTADMKRFLSDKRWGKQFEKEIRDLKITKGDIRQ